MLEPLPPWLQQEWSGLYHRHAAGTMPHAVLIEGTAGIGKTVFARFLAQALLCGERSAQGACGQCASCVLLRAGSHPDFSEYHPAEDSTVIKVEQVRAMVDWLRLTPQYHSYKIAILRPAQAMNRSAANGLLKTLEEPAVNDVIVLLTEHSGELPATVVSRCQRIKLSLHDRATALSWLESQGIGQAETALALAGDGPLLARSAMQGEMADSRTRLFAVWQDILLGKASVAKCVDAVSDIPVRRCLSLMCAWVADISLLQVDQNARIRHPDLRCALAPLGPVLKREQWFTLYDQLLHLYRTDSASIKTQAVLEGIFADIRLNQTTRNS